MKKEIDAWVSDNYSYLDDLTKYNFRYNKNEDMDMISYYYLYLLDRGWRKIYTLSDIDKRKFTKKWFHNTSRWQVLKTKNGKPTHELGELGVNNIPEDFIFIEEADFQIDIEINSEDLPDYMKDWIVDMTQEFGESVDKLILVRYHYLNSLTLPEKVLYDLTYTQMMTIRQIAKKINIPPSATFNMVRDLEKRLKELCLKS